MGSINNYSWVLFDADDTLFHFDAFSGLQRLFQGFKIDFSKEDYYEYEQINRALWVQYQNGEITAGHLQSSRFSLWASRLNCNPHDLNHSFITVMAELCTPIEGAVCLLDTIKEKVRIGIVTNGFTQLQEARLNHTGLKHYFDLVVVSEEVGRAKPDKMIFDHTLNLMGNPEPSEVLMVGDNPDSDILGGLNAGFKTCWFNQHKKPKPQIQPHFEVSSLYELKDLFMS